MELPLNSCCGRKRWSVAGTSHIHGCLRVAYLELERAALHVAVHVRDFDDNIPHAKRQTEITPVEELGRHLRPAVAGVFCGVRNSRNISDQHADTSGWRCKGK